MVTEGQRTAGEGSSPLWRDLLLSEVLVERLSPELLEVTSPFLNIDQLLAGSTILIGTYDYTSYQII